MNELATPLTAALSLPMESAELDSRIRRGLAAVEESLSVAVAQTERLADEVSRHLLVAGGKRVRPMLTLLAAEFGEPDAPEVVQAATAVELTHLATLYHDDVMDGALLRRGAPTAHMRWGNTVAILVGDVLLARASSVVSALGPEAVRIQAETFERLCLGQLHETVGPAEGEDPVTHYLQVLSDKTGSLVATSARYGAMFSGAGAEVEAALREYGEKVGVAFQLADDVIDLLGDGASTGKTPGTDLREHVPTLPVLLLRRYVGESGDVESKELLALLDGDLSEDRLLARAVSGLAAHQVTEQARLEANRWATEATEHLDRLPDSAARDALTAFAAATAARTA